MVDSMRKKRREVWRAGTVPFYGLKAQKKRGDVVSRFREGDVPLSGEDAQPERMQYVARPVELHAAPR